MDKDKTYSAFTGPNLLASGTLDEVLAALKSRFDDDAGTLFLIFDDQTGRQVDFDLRGTLADVRARYRAAPARMGPGRPKLGVIAREVSLLPRHWEWLEQEPNGASAAIRRLVDEARKRNPGEQQARSAIEAAGRFLSAMAGDLPGYEEASRALYCRNKKRFHEHTREWPRDIRLHAHHLVRGVL
ncbi:MAG TPA: DUF2239 family protein [Verrucomicrobiae bacterium]|nr:DUF2239 family protein [Verrucomicrobiae bacterium]